MHAFRAYRLPRVPFARASLSPSSRTQPASHASPRAVLASRAVLTTPPQLAGWSVRTRRRRITEGKDGHKSQSNYKVFSSPEGRTFYSTPQVLRHLGFEAGPGGEDRGASGVDGEGDFWIACDRCHKWYISGALNPGATAHTLAPPLVYMPPF